MRVAELQQFLGQIVPFVKAAKASDAVASELSRTALCLEPFKDKTLGEFNDFLVKAEEYQRTGVFTRRAGTPRTPKADQAPKLTVTEAAQIFLGLYERATDPTLDHDFIDAEISKFNDLTVDELKGLAKEVNKAMPKSKMTKLEMVGAFKRMIKDPKESHERNHPQPAAPTPEPAARAPALPISP